MKADRIVVVGHGELPEALLASARLIAGDLAGVTALGLRAGEAPTSYGTRLSELLGGDDVVLILSDLRGGTPDNVAGVISRRRAGTCVVAGASLPLLIECALGDVDLDENSLAELSELTRAAVSHSSLTPVP